MATDIDIPAMGESITEAVLVRWIKSDGERVQADEPICELETDKANFDLPAPAAGVLRTVKQEGETVRVGETIGRIDDSAPARADSAKPVRPAVTGDASAGAKVAPSGRETAGKPRQQSAAKSASRGTAHAAPPPDNAPEVPESQHELSQAEQPVDVKLDEADARQELEPVPRAPAAETERQPPEPLPSDAAASVYAGDQGVRRVAMSKIRRRIAERLVAAQNQAALLTAFNEIDMAAVLDLRNRFKARFEQAHGVPLGLMSFFARACVLALHEFQALSAEIDGNDVLYHEYVHLGIAVSMDRGLVVPVLRNVEAMSFGRIESEVKRVAAAARDGKLSLQELSGGTFTITNGGVFGSLVSTPILNPPQSGILGMHAIQKRPVVVNDRIEIRPMMYVALTYDHRLVDGKDSVQFLVRVKELIEEPVRMALGI